MTTQLIPISSIEDYRAFFQPWSAEPRTERHTAQIERYKEAMKEGRVPPPIVVCEVDGAADAIRLGFQALGPVNFCSGACEEFLRQEKDKP